MKKYIVLQSTSLQSTPMKDLVDSVNQHIKMGYVPQGGICVGDFGYYQAMIIPELDE